MAAHEAPIASTKTLDERDREMKKKVRQLLVTIVSGLSNDDITNIIGNEKRLEAFFSTISKSINQKFPDIDNNQVKKFWESIVGNMVKCFEDLHGDAPKDIDSAKLIFWNSRWKAERERSRRAKYIDTQTIFSKRMRKEQVLMGAEQFPTVAEQGTSAASLLHTEGNTAYMERSVNNYMVSFTLGIDNEVIKRGKKVGSGAYGTVHLCTIVGVSFLPSENTYCAKEFKGQAKAQFKSFAIESAVDLNHRGIVRAIAHTRCPPWVLIFPYFNGPSLGELMEFVPAPKGTLSNISVAQGETTNRTTTKEDIQRATSVCNHAPALIHALVQGLAFAHQEGMIHTDLHPWNIMLDFTREGTPRVGIIDWGMAMRVGVEKRGCDGVTGIEHTIRPWRAPELVDVRIENPWTKASDVYALAWAIHQLCTFFYEFDAFFKANLATTKASFEVQAIQNIINIGYLTVAPRMRKSMKELDVDLSRLNAQPEQCLRPISEMGISFSR